MVDRPLHGGRLREAQRRYPRVSGEWLDLSTGIAPWSWPLPEVPAAVWQRLPEEDGDLRRAAADYYAAGEHAWLPVAGSQAAIEGLPRCLPPARVAVPAWGYREHAFAWQRAGHRLCHYRDRVQLDAWLTEGRVDHLVVIDPNNPTAERLPPELLQRWQQPLQERGGLLVLDQAFADAEAVNPLLPLYGGKNVVVMRSVGKFFGLAGLRLGFVSAEAALLARLEHWQPLWGVAGPAQWLGQRMLEDRTWQAAQRRRIDAARARLCALLEGHFGVRSGDDSSGGSAWRLRCGPLFCTLFGPEQPLRDACERLQQQGILLRLFEPQEGLAALRFGLADDKGWARLRQGLAQLTR